MNLSHRNRGGRPKKAPDEKHSVKVAIRFRRDEWLLIEQRAAAAEVAPSTYIRMAVAGNVTVRQVRTLSAVDRHDLARVGANLNQLLRRDKAAGPVLADLQLLLRRFDELE